MQFNKADLARLLHEVLSYQVTDFITADRYESPETMECSPDGEHGILICS